MPSFKKHQLIVGLEMHFLKVPLLNGIEIMGVHVSSVSSKNPSKILPCWKKNTLEKIDYLFPGIICPLISHKHFKAHNIHRHSKMIWDHNPASIKI
jgi:hypothetical protein